MIYATGYLFGFPFLEKGLADVVDNVVPLYKRMFPPHLPHATLAILGAFQPLGAVNPISEMQARWALRLFLGASPPPPRGRA